MSFSFFHILTFLDFVLMLIMLCLFLLMLYGKKTLEVTHGSTRIRCYYGQEAALRMSWKVKTFGRRFFNCPKMQHEQYSFFDWFDKPTCQRGREVRQKLVDKISKLKCDILKLNMKVEAMQSHLKTSKKGERNAIRVLIVSWVLVILIIAWLVEHVRFSAYVP
ncbi:putative zinc finger, GRF-type [Senna tora]|uniref:Putative zinc finger, GRF-type n=1 Tax=Senna tora TaxID=362788 RepID=A0A834X0Q8_9FABA|nr:putative zinc finger, GRF-type [Senna tora]